MSATALTRDLVVSHTRALKLPGVARTFERLAREACDQGWPHDDYLQEVLSAEVASRHESVIRQRLREARFPEVKTLDQFDISAVEGVTATQIHTLARGDWVTAPENLILAGPIGTGKTHLAIALGVEATRQKRRVCSRAPPTSSASCSTPHPSRRTWVHTRPDSRCSLGDLPPAEVVAKSRGSPDGSGKPLASFGQFDGAGSSAAKKTS